MEEKHGEFVVELKTGSIWLTADGKVRGTFIKEFAQRFESRVLAAVATEATGPEPDYMALALLSMRAA